MGMFVRLTLIPIILFTLSGCNIWSGLDTPSDDQDRFLAAQAKADDGDCAGAVELLQTIASRNDQQNIALGWAQLCVGGATAKAIASSLYNFSSGSSTGSSGSLTVVGELARSIYPTTQAKIGALDAATVAFLKISNTKIRQLEVAISQLVRSAAVLAQQGTTNNSARLTRDDIAPIACDAVASDCTGGCAATTSGTISDSDVSTFTNLINAAATGLGSASAGNLTSLSTLLNSRVGGASNVVRCFIYKEMIPNP